MVRLFFLSILFILTKYVVAQDVVINEFMSSNSETIDDEDGDSSDWVELYNTSSLAINLDGFFLSDDASEPTRWSFPSVIIPANNFVLVFASGKNRLDLNELHTNFKISTSGEPLILANPAGVIVDQIAAIAMDTDRSYGRLNDGSESLGRLFSATPNATNNGQSFLSNVQFSHEAGFYPEPFQLTISSENAVYYTLDGSEPTTASKLVNGSIMIDAERGNNISNIPTTYLPYADQWPNEEFGFKEPASDQDNAAVLRARSYHNGEPTSEVYTRTFFTSNVQYSYPVFSLTTDSLSLFDYDTGLFIPGQNFDPENPNWTGNYFESGINWERNCHIELFEYGNLEVSDNVGFRIAGNGTRAMPQKSVRLYWRNEYGNSSITYPFFKHRDYSKYKRLTLRSSFTYWYWSGGKNTLFQDDILHQVIAESDADLETQSSRPSILFINGEYWGIQNMRETHGNHFLSNLYGFDRDSIDIIDGDYLTAEEGSAEDFESLYEFIRTNDLSQTINYEYLKSKIDVRNYIDYFIVQTYFGNRDWPRNNVKIWKSQRSNAKWRWLLFDLDGCVPEDDYNSFAFRSDSTETQAFIFNQLIKNETFKQDFINRYIYHFETTFSPSKIASVLNDFRNTYAQEMYGHIGRWNNPQNMEDWESSCEVFLDFVIKRPCHMKEKLASEFNLEDSFWKDCDQAYADFEIDVYPNPSNGTFTIRVDKPIMLSGTLSVTNIHGQIIYSDKLNTLSQTIDLSHLKNGVYFLNATKNELSKTTKVVVLQ